MKNAIKGFVKESFLVGLGAASLTKKKAEALAKSLVKKGILSRKDGAGLVRKILAEANSERKRIEKFVKGEIKRELKNITPAIKKAGARATREGKKAVKKGAAKAGRMVKNAAKKVIRKIR